MIITIPTQKKKVTLMIAHQGTVFWFCYALLLEAFGMKKNIYVHIHVTENTMAGDSLTQSRCHQFVSCC